MSHAISLAPRPGRLRTITPPPPILDWTREMASLEEAGPELAVAFWRVLRKVRAWAETPPEGRAGLFAINRKEACERLGAACGLAPGLVEAFGTFSVLVRAPGRVEARQLAEACHQVHEWAEERSLIEVAMLFAEAAAFADPDDPAWANDAGRMCRRAAKDERASSWYHRGYGLGARFDTPEEVIRAQIGYGNLMKDLGQHEEGRKFLERAARRAIYTGRKRQAGEAHHDLLSIAAEVGEFRIGERHARKALDYYPIRHPRIPLLAQDWAFLLIRRRFYSPAMHLLGMALPCVHSPTLQTLVWGNLARAAAGARQEDIFRNAENLVLQLVDRHQEFAPSALNGLAEGSWAFCEWDKAEQFASKALEIARVRKDGGEERVAFHLLKRLAVRDTAPVEDHPLNHERLQTINLRFEVRLKKWRAPDNLMPGADPTKRSTTTVDVNC